MSPYLTDLRHSWRIFRHNPGLAGAAVIALALGIGFTTTMFGIVHGGTRPLPTSAPESVVAVAATHPAAGLGHVEVRPFELRRWRQTLGSFDDLAAYRALSVNVSSDREGPERVPAAEVTPNAFDVVGARPLLGRRLSAADAEAGARPVVVLSHELWQRRFLADPAILGRTLRVAGVPHVVVGVMPEGFGFPIRARLWLPLSLEPASGPGSGVVVEVFGRLAAQATPDTASAELELEMARLGSEYPETFAGRSGRVFPFAELETPPEIRRGLYLLVLAVSFVLLIACANVANLLLARAALRARDTAIRTALGASRARLISLHLLEAGVLTAVAAVLGLGLATAGLRFFASASSDILDAYWMDFRVDLTVAAFAALLGFLAAASAGLLPALRASSAGVGAMIPQLGSRTTGARIGRLGHSLVIAQLTMACGLLVITTTLVGSAASLRTVDLRFQAESILTAQTSVPATMVDDPDTRARFVRDLTEALSAQPELERSALVSNLPGRGGIGYRVMLSDDPPAPGTDLPMVDVVTVTPEFFEMAVTPRVRGRTFTWRDDGRAARVVVVNEAFVERYSPDREVLGRALQVGGERCEIVGVVSSLLMQDVDEPDSPGVYLPMLQARPFAVRLMAATSGPPVEAAGAVRRAVAAVDADLPVFEFASLHDAIFADLAVLDALATLFFGFGLGAVFLAVVGLYAVLSFLVTSRTRELGVRMALGATRRDVLALVARHGARQLAWGLGLGLTLAFAMSRIIASQVERIPAAGAGVLSAIAAFVVAGAIIALWRPARRALQLEPVEALRVD